ncbi:MAG: hypothetical protein JNM56_03620 [Planctomycetia bacterium]|nr:hypothetical protein [Planctomycetia bacterium]
MRTLAVAGLAILCGFLLVGCNYCCPVDASPAADGDATAVPSEATAAECSCCSLLETAAADPADKDWGTIKGQIVFGGDKVPDRAELKVDKDQQHCLEKGKLLNEEWVVNKDNKGIRWVFVWLAPDPSAGKKDIPIHPSLKEIKDKKVAIDQPCCAFEPHALAVREGQVVVAKNSSPIAHNFNYAGHPLINQGKNQLMPPKSEFEIDNLRADEKFPVSVSCNIHGWMKAYVRVFNHPYFAVTNEKGEFEIKNAPAGDWRLKVWHDSGWRGGAMGRDGEKISVKGGAVTDLGKLEMKP